MNSRLAPFLACLLFPAATFAQSPSAELSPADVINRYYRAIAAGDEAIMRSSVFVHPGPNELARSEKSIAVLAATARFRFACDKAFSQGKLLQAGFHCMTERTQIPTNTNFKIDGDRAVARQRGIDMIRIDGVWKEDFLPWDSKDNTLYKAPGMTPEKLIANLAVIADALEKTTTEVAAGKYLSAADAFGVLNARLKGHARMNAPLPIAYVVDLAALAPSATSSVPIIQLRGDPAALGKSHAEQLGPTIKALYHEYFANVFHLDQDAGRAKYNQALAVAAGFENFIRPEHREEIRALATGLGLKPAELFLAQSFADLNDGGAE